MLRPRRTAQAVLTALCIASCGAESLASRAVGQYAFVEAKFSITGEPAETTLVAGLGRTFGNLILHPDGRLTGAGALSGMDAYMSGRWSVEDDELHFVLDSVGTFPGSSTPLPARLTGRELTFTFATTPPTVRRAYVVAMKSDLGLLLRAEEKYFEDAAAYTSDLRRLHFSPAAGVNAPTFSISQGAFSAAVTHAQLADTRCAIAKGMRNPVDSSARDGQPICALPPERDSLLIAYTWRRSP